MSTVSGREVAEAGLTDWTYLRDALHTRLTCGYAAGLRLVAAIGAAAEQLDHHPDLDLRYGHLDVRLVSHDVQGVTRRDLRLARRISELAAAEGVPAAPHAAQLVELGLDTPDREAVLPFWRAVLAMREPGPGAVEQGAVEQGAVEQGADEQGADELRDDVLPTLWFQQSGREEPRQRFHLDLWVAPEVVQDRIAQAVAAGGVLVSAAQAPAFWVLADPDGNRVCLCTWQDRDG